MTTPYTPGEKAIEEQIKPILENMVYQIMKDRPENVLNFMIKWLQKEGNYTHTGLTKEEKYELETLRREIARYRDLEQGEGKEEGNDLSFENEDEEKEDKDFDEKIITRQKEKRSTKRTGVSAEVYGTFNKKEDFKPRVIPKSHEQKQKIKARILNSFLFTSLEQKNLNIVIDAMDEKTFKAEEDVIRQGEPGDCLYVIEIGELHCVRRFAKDGEEKFLKKYIPGDSFGELALLYNAPRAATIRAKTDCVLWVLDRETFNHIVKEAAQKKREKYEQFLKKVDILSTIDNYELMQISDALRTATYEKDNYIIKEGDSGDVFYFLEEGECIATKQLEPGKPLVEILCYHEGNYFGERALIKGEPRYANIQVSSNYAKVISLDRTSFKRLLGPIEPLLQRNIDKYAKFVGDSK